MVSAGVPGPQPPPRKMARGLLAGQTPVEWVVVGSVEVLEHRVKSLDMLVTYRDGLPTNQLPEFGLNYPCRLFVAHSRWPATTFP